MTRKDFLFQETCTDDDLNAIVEDIGLVEVVATYPWFRRDIGITTRVVGDWDTIASNGTDALAYQIVISPVVGGHLWFRYELNNETTLNTTVAIEYRIYNHGDNEFLGSVKKTYTQTTSRTIRVDVLDLNSVAGADLNGTEIRVDVYAYWDESQKWMDAIKFTDDFGNAWLSLEARSDDRAIYLFGEVRQYRFWDVDHAMNSWSVIRNASANSRSCKVAYHPAYGMCMIGYAVSISFSTGKIRNDVDHYATGSPDSDETDLTTITGFGLPTGIENNYMTDIVRGSDSFWVFQAQTNAGAPYVGSGSVLRNIYGPLSGTPTYGTAVHILNGPGSDTWLPVNGAGHPDVTDTLKPQILDLFVEQKFPGSSTHHLFLRANYEGTTDSSGTWYQFKDSEFEEITELRNWYNYDNDLYSDPGFFAPAAKRNDSSVVSIAYWEHIKTDTNEHTMHLKVISRVGTPGEVGTWTVETVESWTLLTDVVFGKWGFNAGITNGMSGDNNSVEIDYGYDKSNGRHLVYSRHDPSSSNRQVYYRSSAPGSSAWTAEEKISNGSEWDGFDDGDQNLIYHLKIVKENGFVPWNPGTDIRVAWSARSFLLVEATFLTGISNASDEDLINVYAPTIMQNNRDDTAGPEDMLW